MPTRSFHEWLAHRSDEPLAAEKVAMLIAQAGPNGISPNELARALHLPSETLNNLVRSLVETGQVAVFKINGELKYRATG